MLNVVARCPRAAVLINTQEHHIIPDVAHITSAGPAGGCGFTGAADSMCNASTGVVLLLTWGGSCRADDTAAGGLLRWQQTCVDLKVIAAVAAAKATAAAAAQLACRCCSSLNVGKLHMAFVTLSPDTCTAVLNTRHASCITAEITIHSYALCSTHCCSWRWRHPTCSYPYRCT
jgi:hypothetical protein